MAGLLVAFGVYGTMLIATVMPSDSGNASAWLALVMETGAPGHSSSRGVIGRR
jgi:hypothetical protein